MNIQDALNEIVALKGTRVWRWDRRKKFEGERDSIPQGAFLGDTLMMLDDSYEGSSDDCALVEMAINDLPDALAEAIDRISKLEAALALSAPLINELTVKLIAAEKALDELYDWIGWEVDDDGRLHMNGTTITLSAVPNLFAALKERQEKETK